MRFCKNCLCLVTLLIILSGGLAFPQADPHPENVLAVGKPADRQQVLIDLGVPKDIAEEYADLSPSMESEIGWFPIHGSKYPTVVLFLPCQDGNDGAYLYLLSQRSGKWSSVDSTVADCHYKGAVTIELAPVFSRSADALLLHHSCEGHGTGYAEHHLFIFDLRSGRFMKRFERLEDLFVAGWGVPGFEQHSIFLVIPRADAPSQIEETQGKRMIDARTHQVSSVNERLRRRTFTWSQEQHRFLASPFHPVE
jgi:hypothetical protein